MERLNTNLGKFLKKIEEPFEYYICDNFLSKSEINLALSIVHQKANTIQDSVKIRFRDLVKHRDFVLAQFEKVKSLVKDTKGLFLTGHLAYHPENYIFPSHLDHPSKKWSFVTYIGPKEAEGTLLIKDNKVVDQVEWKQGRCWFFQPSNISYHAVDTKGKPRVTMVCNVRTDNELLR